MTKEKKINGNVAPFAELEKEKCPQCSEFTLNTIPESPISEFKFCTSCQFKTTKRFKMAQSKWRCWDYDEDKMYYPGDTEDIYIDGFGFPVRRVPNKTARKSLSKLFKIKSQSNNIVPMMFVGVNDKTDRPFYQGDFFRFEADPKLYMINLSYVRLPINNGGVDCMASLFGFYFDGISGTPTQSEIIGNPFQTPELWEEYVKQQGGSF